MKTPRSAETVLHANSGAETVAVPPSRTFDVAVVGGGPAGLSAALALVKTTPSLRVAVIGPRAKSPGIGDIRTVALFGPSLTLLGRLGVLEALEAVCQPITGIRLVDATGGLLRAPETLFNPAEIGLDRFGLNVPNGLLVDLLEGAVTQHPAITRLDTATVSAVTGGAEAVRLDLADGTRLHVQLAVAADGRSSITRDAAGISARTWDYEQSAIVTRFSHVRPHNGISSEIHRQHGPCTIVPLPGSQSSLVWVERPAIAQRLLALGDDDFRDALATVLSGLVGRIGELAQRRAIPLMGLKPNLFAANRIAAIGEAAHVFPPIGAQGLNLGLRDAAGLADAVQAHGRLDRSRSRTEPASVDLSDKVFDPGTNNVLAAYDADRQADVGTRTFGVDMLGRSLTSPNPVFGIARGLGLHLAHAVPSLRRAMISAGLGPISRLPSLMRQ